MLTLLRLMPWRHAALGRVWVLVTRFCVSIIFLITVWPVSPGLYCTVLYCTVLYCTVWPVSPRQPRPRYIHTGPQVRDKSRSGHLLSWYTIACFAHFICNLCTFSSADFGRVSDFQHLQYLPCLPYLLRRVEVMFLELHMFLLEFRKMKCNIISSSETWQAGQIYSLFGGWW